MPERRASGRPDWKGYVTGRLAGLELSGPREAEIVEELAQHLESVYEDALGAGSAPDEAFARATALFPEGPALARELRAIEGRPRRPDGHDAKQTWLGGLLQDVRFGLRSLFKTPAFTAICLVTLAVGIGANAVIFSLVDAVLVRPLPYRDADRLVLVRADVEGHRSIASLSAIELLDLRERTTSFEDFAAVWSSSAALTELETPEQVDYAWATRNLFPLLGAEPILGRLFTAEEEAPNGPPVALLSAELWERHYGSDPSILGRTIEVDDTPREVVGVLPPGFRLLLGADTDVSKRIEVWVPQTYWVNRGMRWLRIVGRMKPDVTLASAREELDVVAANLDREFTEYRDQDLAFHVVPLHEDLVRDVEPAMLTLFGAVGFVLLIACTNVASLILTRTRARAPELALRTALGASRARIVRQIVTESAILALFGGALGILLASASMKVLPAFAPRTLPRLDEVAFDGRVVVFALAASFVACLAFGVLPALRGTRLRVQETLREGGRDGRRAPLGRSLRDSLVVAEIALSFVLLVGAGLMLRTLFNLEREDIGFDSEQVLSLEVPLSFADYDTAERRWLFYRELTERIESMPGVRSAGAVSLVPLGGGLFTSPYAYDAATEEEFGALSADYRTVTPGYFETMRARLLDGRTFEAADSVSGRRVVVIDDTLAREAFPGESAVGRRVKVDLTAGVAESSPEWMEIIGVVQHLRHERVSENGRPQVYFPAWISTDARIAFVVRSNGDPELLASGVQEAVVDMGSRRPVHAVHTMDHYLEAALSSHRFTVRVMLVFAATAVLLAAIGVYGVIAFLVSQRRHELGVRFALGADARDVLSMLLREGVVLAAAGSVLGLIGALALGRFLESLVFGVATTDVATFAATGLLLFGVTLVACARPAWRATRIDPVVALRHD